MTAPAESHTDFWGHEPPAAKEGPYKIGAIIMVSRDSMGADWRMPELPEWFPAQVCYPANGNNYRWYDPFIHYRTDCRIHKEPDDVYPAGQGYVGKLWYPAPEPLQDRYRPLEFWAYPIAIWRELFA